MGDSFSLWNLRFPVHDPLTEIIWRPVGQRAHCLSPLSVANAKIPHHGYFTKKKINEIMVLEDCLAYGEGLPTGLRLDARYHIIEQASQRVHLSNKATLNPYYIHS